MMYRVKTKKEFEKEFGQYWRSSTRFEFAHGMDYLLGQVVHPYEVFYDKTGGIRSMRVKDNPFTGVVWALSTDMLVPIRAKKVKRLMKRSRNKTRTV